MPHKTKNSIMIVYSKKIFQETNPSLFGDVYNKDFHYSFGVNNIKLAIFQLYHGNYFLWFGGFFPCGNCPRPNHTK